MLYAVMRAPMSFFELTPTGRYVLTPAPSVSVLIILHSILNLFSRDTYVVDQVLARVIQNVVRTLCVTAMIIFVIGYSFPFFVSPWLIIYHLFLYSVSLSPFLRWLGSIPESWCTWFCLSKSRQ